MGTAFVNTIWSLIDEKERLLIEHYDLVEKHKRARKQEDRNHLAVLLTENKSNLYYTHQNLVNLIKHIEDKLGGE